MIEIQKLKKEHEELHKKNSPSSSVFTDHNTPRQDGKIENPLTLGRIIRVRRKELGYTQARAAQICKCSPRFISELERGIAGGNIAQVLYVCRVLGIDIFAKVRENTET